MKKIIFTLLIGSFLVSCEGNNDGTKTGPNEDEKISTESDKYTDTTEMKADSIAH